MTQVRWEYLTPPEFKKLAKEEKVCILPIGSLERHGEHMPFGTDGLTAHKVSVLAAEKEHCVVFPAYWFGQVHEASCFAGTVNFPTDLLCKMLETLLDQIAHNGFEKILLVSGHGGNAHFLDYFMMSQMERDVNYTLYYAFTLSGPRFNALDIWEAPGGGHADESETSMIMAVAPGTVKMEQQCYAEPIEPLEELKHLSDNKIHTALWWYGLYPENVSGSPSAGTAEKGEAALNAAALDVAEALRIIKADTAAPRMQQEYYERVHGVKKGE
jgi:creatinine amidohydrolase